MSADLASAALQSGCAWRIRAYAPATTGLDIDVPAIAWNSSPAALPVPGSGVGEAPARTWTPGAITSGLMMSSDTGSGPREENTATEGADFQVLICPVMSCATGCAEAATYALMARPGVASTCTDGTVWLSVNRLSTLSVLYRIIPAPPAWATARLFSARPIAPRWQSTILPVTTAGLSAPGMHSSLPAATESTSGRTRSEERRVGKECRS